MRLTLCGSARFEKQFRQLDKQFTLAGHTVYNLAVYPSEMGEKHWYTDAEKQALDAAHKDKILNSDAIVVLNYGTYIGESTRSEIEFAKANGKTRYYVAPFSGEDDGGIRLCPYNYCRDQGSLATPPCPVCYE